MRRWAVVVAQAFFWCAPVAADDVLEVVNARRRSGRKAIGIVQRDDARFHVPLVCAGVLERLLNMRLRFKVFPKYTGV